MTIDPNLTLVLIEDNDIDVMVVQRLIRRLSIDPPIVRAGNGEEALALLRAPCSPPRPVPPYVIMLDLNMPRMTGFEFLEEISGDEDLAEVPIFILSTSDSPHDQRTAQRYRVQGYLVKPLREEQLVDVLASA